MDRGLGRVQRSITNRHERLGVHAGLGNPDSIDSKDPHLVEDALDHLGGLIGGLRKDLEVQLHPALRALLLPLQEVTWMAPQTEVSAHGKAMGLQVSWSSERHIKRSHDPDRSEAMNLGLVSGSQSSQQSPVMGLGVRNSHES